MRRLGFVLLVVFAMPAGVRAQGDPVNDLRQSQLRLDSIRQERLRLEQEMQGLQTRVRDASRELTNISRQRTASLSALQELEFQSEILNAQIDGTRSELDHMRERLEDRADVLESRLRSIYKRGPMHAVRVLLGAESFADLLNRYKYLHLITMYDQRVVDDVARLERELRGQQETLALSLGQFESLRMEKSSEVAQLRRLESATQRALSQYRQQETQVSERLDQAAQDEARLNDMIATVERGRRDQEARDAAAGNIMPAGPLSGRMLGSLAWPVDGQVIYNFGPVRKPSGITLINKGIGIRAPVGTPVRVVAPGTVSLARPFEGYGRTVMVSHGGGYYTLYLFLRSISVQEGMAVNAGHVLGTVGGETTPDGAHLYFQVHAPIQQGGGPEPVDPLLWLRPRGTP